MVIGFLALMGGVFAYGYHKGSLNQISKFEAQRVKTQEKLFDLGEEVVKKNAELRRLQKEKEDLINELETSARDAIGADNPGVGANGGLRRLEQRWGSPSGSP